MSLEMAAESSEGEEEGKLSGGNQILIVDEDLRELGKKAAWSVSSCKTGNGVSSLRDDNLETYWQSDGAQPHFVNIQFQKKVRLQLVVLYVDFKLDESYTPSKISIRAGDGFHNLKEIKAVELVKPTGWLYLSLSGVDPRETFVNAFMLQIAVLSNHLNGRDTHVRQIKVYGPRPYVSDTFLINFLDIYSYIISAFLCKPLLQEPHSTAAISIYFKRVHHLLYYKMRFYGWN
ncbi:unnamed protein product [Trifolium pratense]|uniref:Uncharacterized protein n=1 Tax=Trifolium pratense TaxID=57577 RepID=A0ACB0IUA7_TRIPR|nr:unnamed protein product [Trifolium pratense]